MASLNPKLNHGKLKPNSSEDKVISGVAIIPDCGTVTNRIAGLLHHRGMRTISQLQTKIKQLLRSVHDLPLGCKSQEYIKSHANVGHITFGRQEEHQQCLRLVHTDKSALTDHYYTVW